MEIQPPQTPPVMPVATAGMSVGAKLAIGFVAVAVLGGGGYYGYAKFTDSKPVTDFKPEVTKTAEPIPVATNDVPAVVPENQRLTFTALVSDLRLQASYTGQDPDSDVIVTLQGVLHNPPIILTAVARSEANYTTVQNAIKSSFSANKAGDYEWVLENWAPEDLAKIKDMTSDPELRKRATEGMASIQSLQLLGEFVYGDYVIAPIMYVRAGVPGMVIPSVYKKVDGMWKATNALSSDKTLDIVETALGYEPMEVTVGTQSTQATSTCKSRYPELDLVAIKPALPNGGSISICVPKSYAASKIKTADDTLLTSSIITSFMHDLSPEKLPKVLGRVDHPEPGDHAILVTCGWVTTYQNGVEVNLIDDIDSASKEWLANMVARYGTPVLKIVETKAGRGFDAELVVANLDIKSRVWEYNSANHEGCEITSIDNNSSNPNISQITKALFDSIEFIP